MVWRDFWAISQVDNGALPTTIYGISANYSTAPFSMFHVEQWGGIYFSLPFYDYKVLVLRNLMSCKSIGYVISSHPFHIVRF